MAAIVLPRTCGHTALIRALAGAGVLNERASQVTLQVPDGCFIFTGALSFLCGWGLRHRQDGPTIRFVGDDDARRYLSRMDLFRLLEVPVAETFRRQSETGRFLPLRLIDGSVACGSATDALCDLILHQFENARAFLPALEWAANEVMDNILLHAESPVAGTVSAQYFPNLHRLDIGICDMGRGIKVSLEEAMFLWSHGDAVTKALGRGVTRNPAVGQGNGLAGTLEIARANGGRFHLWTGDVDYRLVDGVEKGFEQIPACPGTGVLLSLDTSRPVNLGDTFIGEAAYTFIENQADRALEAGLSVRSECISTGVRETAARLRRKVEALLPGMCGPLVFDFTGMEFASSSFLDELLGRLMSKLGPAEFHARIAIRNAAADILAMANVVIGQRVAALPGKEEPVPSG